MHREYARRSMRNAAWLDDHSRLNFSSVEEADKAHAPLETVQVIDKVVLVNS